MARRKHQHARYQRLSWNHNEYTHDGITQPFEKTTVDAWRLQSGRHSQRPRRGLARPTPARDSDPLTIMLLLDAILRTNPDAYLNAGNLTDHIVASGEYRQVMWNGTVVGRLLSCLYDIAGEVTIPNGGTRMIDRVNYGGQRNYILQPDIHTWRWLGCLREHFGQLAAKTIDDEIRLQEPNQSLTSQNIWLGFDFAYGAKPEETR